MHIKSATGKKTVNNTKTCAYNTGHYEWPCVMITLRIMQQLPSKRVSTCRWFSKYKKILKVGQQSVLLPIDALRHVLVPAMCVGGRHYRPRSVRYSQHTDARAVMLPTFIIDLPIYILDDLCARPCNPLWIIRRWRVLKNGNPVTTNR